MKRVLIVDDAMFMREALKNILVKGDFEIVGEAGNGIEAIEKYKSTVPDCVTMDITMPEMDGIQAIKKIKELDKNAKIVVVSAMGQEAMVRDAVIAGAKGFIVKPFKAEHVIETLQKL